MSRCQLRHRPLRIEKKESELISVNTEYIEKHTKGRSPLRIRVEMDEMWIFYHDKGNQLWLWWVIDHDTGVVIGYWFGTREHDNLDKLMALLSPLSIGRVYADGNAAYAEKFSAKVLVVSKTNVQKIERKH